MKIDYIGIDLIIAGLSNIIEKCIILLVFNLSMIAMRYFKSALLINYSLNNFSILINGLISLLEFILVIRIIEKEICCLIRYF